MIKPGISPIRLQSRMKAKMTVTYGTKRSIAMADNRFRLVAHQAMQHLSDMLRRGGLVYAQRDPHYNEKC